jgi:hypothetical protein
VTHSTTASSPKRWLLGVASCCLAATSLAGCTSPQPDCNPYFPVARGAQWVYREARGQGVAMERTVAVSTIETSGRLMTATLRQTVAPAGQPERLAGRATTTVRCAGGAVQIAVEGTAASSAGGESAAATVRAQLPGLPPADKLTPGFQWSSEGRVETADGGATVVTSIKRRSQVDGVFPVSVPAGDFAQAVRVASVETLKLGGTSGEREAEQEVQEWYVRGVGLVKRDTRLAGADQPVGSVEELVSFSGIRPQP